MKILDQLKALAPTVSVGVVTADMMNLGSELELIESVGIKLLHFDVMDGKFWPSITIGSPFVKAVKTSMLKDVHLLIDKPEDYVEDFVKAGADMIIFNIESCSDVSGTLQKITQMENANDPERGVLKGVSLNPKNPIDAVKPVIDDLDIVTLLAVGPDTGKQNFISELPGRITELKNISQDVLLFIDGAIKKDNIAEVSAMGPDVIITGSAVFDGKAPKENAKFMLKAIGK